MGNIDARYGASLFKLRCRRHEVMESPSVKHLDRAVTSPIGIILILSITLTAAVGILIFGAAALEESQHDSELEQAELALTQFDSRASQVALGDSRTKSVGLGGGNYRVNETAGNVTIVHADWDNDDNDKEILETTNLGTVTYEKSGTTIAYQGGGVWRSDPDGDAQMVSPPEFHYRDRTLTFPVVTVRGDSARSGTTRAHVGRGDTSEVYPNLDEFYDEDETIPFANPTENGSVYAIIESEYCTGWESFFESRSEGAIQQPCHQDDENTVIIDLTVPFEQTFGNDVIVTENYDPKGAGEDPDWTTSNRPSVSSVIENRIEQCASNCDDLDDALGDDIGEGTYYADGDVTFNGETFDTSVDNITIIIDGDLDITGTNSIEGDGSVEILIRGEYDLQDSINENGDADQLQIYVHSSAEKINHLGDSHLTGVVYAPETDFDQRGSGVVKGAIVGREVIARGNPSNTFVNDPSLDDFQTDLGADQSPITFLHVTENEVHVELR